MQKILSGNFMQTTTLFAVAWPHNKYMVERAKDQLTQALQNFGQELIREIKG